MVADPTAPATKADVQFILTHLKELYDNMATKDDLSGMATKGDLSGMATKKDLEKIYEVMATKDELHQMEHRMLVLLEQTRQDLIDAYKDGMENLKIRLKRVEIKVGIEDF